MIEKLKESRGPAFGFKVTGKLSAEDIAALTRDIDLAIAEYRKPIGVLADLSAMHGASWTARWDEMRFLHQHADQIARMAIVSDDAWEEIAEMALLATTVLQAETLYFHSSEILHAWSWVRMKKHGDGMPMRVVYPGKGLFKDYTPEYVGL